MYQNVAYELQGLEKLFAAGLSGLWPPGELFEGVQSPKYVKAEIARIRSQLLGKALAYDDERGLQRYIRFYQRFLIHVCDDIFHKATESSGRYVCQQIEELLSFIELQFPKYFDHDMKPPLSLVVATKQEVPRGLMFLQERFAAMEGDLVLEIALFPFRDFLSPTSETGVTYRTMAYLREIEKELGKLRENELSPDDTRMELQRMFYYLNYNFRNCFDYMINEIERVINATSTTDERLERLAFIQKQTQQFAVKPAMAFDAAAVSLKHYILNYLAAEIDYTLHVRQNAFKSAEASDGSGRSPFRLKLDMSVSQVACLVKVMMDAGLIQNTNTAALVRFVSTHCETKRAEQVSPSSFRIKYYNIEARTLESVRNVLSRLVDRMLNMQGEGI